MAARYDASNEDGEPDPDHAWAGAADDWMPRLPLPPFADGSLGCKSLAVPTYQFFGYNDDEVPRSLEEMLEEPCPYDEPIEMWNLGSSTPLPWNREKPLRRRKAWLQPVPDDEKIEAAAPPPDVFGPGLSRHTWLWRVAESELRSFADEPKRIAEWSPLVVAQAAEEMLASGPAALPELVREAAALRAGDAEAVRQYVAGELERYLRGDDHPVADVKEQTHTEGEDAVASLLARAVVRADFHTLALDLESCAAELLLRNGEAPVELANRVADILRTLGDIPSESTGPALEAAARLVKDGLVPVGRRHAGRAVATAAGWLTVGAGLGCEPTTIAMLLCLPSAPRTLVRAQTRGFGPFGRYIGGDEEDVVAAWRSGGTVVVGLPGTGKTQLLIWLAACAPGAVLAGTPNLLDVYDFAARATDHDCLVFDPGGLMGDAAPPGIKVVRLDLLSLVTDWESAGMVAALIVAASNNQYTTSQYGDFWRTSSAELLRIHLFAAKMGNRPPSALRAWLQHDEEIEIADILAEAGNDEAKDAFAAHIRRHSDNPRTSIVATAQSDFRAFANLSDAGEPFDFDRFVAGRGTLVLLSDTTNSAACEGAVAFMTSQIIEAVYRRFRRSEARAPIACLIDEAPRNPGLAPVLADVLAEGPKSGLNPVAACQTIEQFNTESGSSKEITEAAARTVIFPGAMPSDLLQVAPFISHEVGESEATDLDPARLARPGEGVAHVLEGSSLRRMRPVAAHEVALWRLCNLDAAFSRAGAAPLAWW